MKISSRPWAARKAARWTPGGRPTAAIPSAIPATIRTAGLDYDLIDDQAVVITPPDRYRVVIIPATTMILDTTAIWMDKVIAAGGSVIKIDSTVEVPGAVGVRD